MGCGCGNRNNNAGARQIVRQNAVAPSPFNQPVVQRTAPQLPSASAAPSAVTYNVQPVTAQQAPSTLNAIENSSGNITRRIAWDRTRREAIKRAMGR